MADSVARRPHTHDQCEPLDFTSLPHSCSLPACNVFFPSSSHSPPFAHYIHSDITFVCLSPGSHLIICTFTLPDPWATPHLLASPVLLLVPSPAHWRCLHSPLLSGGASVSSWSFISWAFSLLCRCLSFSLAVCFWAERHYCVWHESAECCVLQGQRIDTVHLWAEGKNSRHVNSTIYNKIAPIFCLLCFIWLFYLCVFH